MILSSHNTKHKQTEEQGRRTYRPWEETDGEELLATKTETGEEEHDPRGRARRGGRRPAGSSVAGGSCQVGRRLAGGICFQASSAAGETCFPAGRSTTRGDELVEEEGDQRGAASPTGLARRGGGSPAGSASR